MSEEKRPVFFLFMAKCPVVAKDLDCNIKDVILYYNNNKTKILKESI
ncbi:MAG: hypothetical protein ACMUIU_10935 [bacterium]